MLSSFSPLFNAMLTPKAAICATSGIPILAPGISRVCGVCKMRCLKVSELEKLAEEHLGSVDAVGDSQGEVCGGCGGKFVV